jgi:hypothetical protein
MKITIEEKWVAVALVYGPPKRNFAHYCSMTVVPLEFRMALEQVFDREEVHRVGLRRMAYDYYEWYAQHENQQRQSTGGDGSLPRA